MDGKSNIALFWFESSEIQQDVRIFVLFLTIWHLNIVLNQIESIIHYWMIWFRILGESPVASIVIYTVNWHIVRDWNSRGTFYLMSLKNLKSVLSCAMYLRFWWCIQNLVCIYFVAVLTFKTCLAVLFHLGSSCAHSICRYKKDVWLWDLDWSAKKIKFRKSQVSLSVFYILQMINTLQGITCL